MDTNNPEHNSRRSFLRNSVKGAGALTAMGIIPASIQKALAVAANNRTGTINDVEHIVIFMQENRSFDHYFGAMRGVRGFADRFPIPVQDTALLSGKTVWYQRNDAATGTSPKVLSVQYNDTSAKFALMRTAGTPHLYPDAQLAWDSGRLTNWPQYKNNASMVYYKEADIPFQYALANAFTLCDAYHCAFTGGTNPNRCFNYTGTNHGKDDPTLPGIYNGPAMDNSYNALTNGTIKNGYTWMTYAERLEDAGVSWQVYQNEEKEFYALNSLLGFKSFRDANKASVPTVSATRTPRQQALYEKGIKTRDLDLLKADVIAGTLPSVVWICATSSGSEHPSASSPAQGAAYTAQVLDALTANPDVWSKTALILNFDENDGFFDHMAPPAPPSYVTYDANPAAAVLAGISTVDASADYLGDDNGGVTTVNPYKHHPFGMGPRVPMYVISPWSKGGWVNSQVFDHTSVLRFVEKRFGIKESNISPWRRAVAGDLTTCFNFVNPNDADVVSTLPNTAALDAASRTLKSTTTPTVSPLPVLPVQDTGTKPSRALPYELQVNATVQAATSRVQLAFINTGKAAAVFHVYDRKHLDRMPRRYTVEAGKRVSDYWDVSADGNAYDLWVLAPNGFHRHFTGVIGAALSVPEILVGYDAKAGEVYVKLRNTGSIACDYTISANAYFPDGSSWTATVAPNTEVAPRWPLASSGNWYDFSVRVADQSGWSRRFAGRVETGKDGISDPAMGGEAIGNQFQIV